MAPKIRITPRVNQKSGTLPNGLLANHDGRLGRLPKGGFWLPTVTSLGHMKLMIMAPPHTRAAMLMAVPQLPSLNGVFSVGHPRMRASRMPMLPSRYEMYIIPVAMTASVAGAA